MPEPIPFAETLPSALLPPVLAVVACLSGPARADMIDVTGMQPYEVCGLCHSLDGVSRMDRFPRLAGQRSAYVVKQFRDFHDGRRTNDGGQMEAITTEVQAGDLPVIAAYFESLPPPPPAAHPPSEAGRRIFEGGRTGLPACSSCHGVGARPDLGAPRIEAQHEAYLVKQLVDFASGARSNDPDGVMQSVSRAMTPDEIAAVANYLAATPRPTVRP